MCQRRSEGFRYEGSSARWPSPSERSKRARPQKGGSHRQAKGTETLVTCKPIPETFRKTTELSRRHHTANLSEWRSLIRTLF